MIKTDYFNSGYQNTLYGHSENQAFKLKPFYHSDLKESLEKIVIIDEPAKEEGIMERVFSDKGKNLKATIKAQFKEIELREELNFHLLNRVDDDICYQRTELLGLTNRKTGYFSYMEQDHKKRMTQLENNIIDLYKEKRKEYLECWRDLMFMKKYLFGALKDYWDISKRREALAHNFTDEE